MRHGQRDERAAVTEIGLREIGGAARQRFEPLEAGRRLELQASFNNVLDLPRMLSGGEPGVARWRYGVLETAIILLIW